MVVRQLKGMAVESALGSCGKKHENASSRNGDEAFGW